MKKLFVLLASLFSLSIYAHVEDSDSLYLLPSGTTIEFNMDFNVKPNIHYHLVGRTSDNVDCFLLLNSSAVSKEDRVISAGTELEIEFREFNYPGVIVPNNDKIDSIFCEYKTATFFTVGQFRDAFSDVFKLKMPEPSEF